MGCVLVEIVTKGRGGGSGSLEHGSSFGRYIFWFRLLMARSIVEYDPFTFPSHDVMVFSHRAYDYQFSGEDF